MPDEGASGGGVQSSESNAGKWILLVLAIIYVAGSLYLLFDLRGTLALLGKDQAANRAEVGDLEKRMQAAEAEAETLGQQVGMTKKDLAQRAAQLQAQTRAAEQRLSEQQKKQISEVTGEVAGVRNDV